MASPKIHIGGMESIKPNLILKGWVLAKKGALALEPLSEATQDNDSQHLASFALGLGKQCCVP